MTPRALVWQAWTDPEQVVRWWGPIGFTTTTSQMDVRPGGTWTFVMHGPDGTDYPNHVVFHEVVEPERLAYTHGGGEGSEFPDFEVVVTFEDLGGKTRLTMHSTFVSAEIKQRLIDEVGALEGAKQTLERLAEHLKVKA